MILDNSNEPLFFIQPVRGKLSVVLDHCFLRGKWLMVQPFELNFQDCIGDFIAIVRNTQLLTNAKNMHSSSL